MKLSLLKKCFYRVYSIKKMNLFFKDHPLKNVLERMRLSGLNSLFVIMPLIVVNGYTDRKLTENICRGVVVYRKIDVSGREY